MSANDKFVVQFFFLQLLPLTISRAAKTMIKLKAALKIACWPKLSNAKLVLVFKEASSYFFNASSYLSASNFSLLKYCKNKKQLLLKVYL